MLSLLTISLVTSLLWGMRHATDPDHVVAVTAIVTQERSLARAAGIGALWGLGHTLTILVVGGAIVLFELAFSPRLGLSMEFTVAVMLVVLGCLNLFDVRPRPSRLTTMRPLLVGVVHGLAGSAAATFLVLPLIRDPRWAAAYLLVFGLGTIAGMALMTLAIAAPSALAAARVAGLQRWIRVSAGALSVGFGLYLAHQIGFVDGLFTSHPTWTPQ
ncbi:MAG: high-affinity nickel-transport family protein [Gemmatimonadaceae bacterium]